MKPWFREGANIGRSARYANEAKLSNVCRLFLIPLPKQFDVFQVSEVYNLCNRRINVVDENMSVEAYRGPCGILQTPSASTPRSSAP